MSTTPEPLTPAPAGTVTGEHAAAAGRPGHRRSQFPAAPGTTTDVAAHPADRSAAPPPNAPDVTASSVAGVWNATVSGQSCKVATPQTKFGAGFRAGPLRCPAPLDGVKSWNVAGKQLALYDADGGVLARLYSSSAESSMARPRPACLSRSAAKVFAIRRTGASAKNDRCTCATAYRPMSPSPSATSISSTRGEIALDPAQLTLARALDRLIDDICDKRISAKSSALGWLFAKRRDVRAPVRGLYIHGGVGRGKTMLMDMFFELVPVRRKRRVHFNDFMADAHDRIKRHRQALKRGDVNEDDPIPPVARALAEEAWVLCFDEFSVTDIADAMILSRLFSALFAAGVVLVATSNVLPDDLYRDGLNRPLFEPFIRMLKDNTQIFALRRRQGLPAGEAERHAGLHHAGRCRRRRPDGRGLAGDDPRHPDRRERDRRSRAGMSPVPRAAGKAARFSFRRSLRKAARRARLPGDRRQIRHHFHRPRPGAGRRQAQRGEAAHLA